MGRIFCISGMGADERIFNNLHIEGYEIVPVRWVPFSKDDDLRSYARKLSDQITTPNPVLLGLSFGGMLAVEIGKIIAARQVFLVSSAKSTSELPWIGRLPIAAMLVNLVPEKLFGNAGKFGFNLAGSQNAEERNLLSVMMKSIPVGFIKQSLKCVLTWNNKDYPSNIIQLHGTSDKIIPPANVHPTYWIKDGGHIMIYNRAAEVSKLISESLA